MPVLPGLDCHCIDHTWPSKLASSLSLDFLPVGAAEGKPLETTLLQTCPPAAYAVWYSYY